MPNLLTTGSSHYRTGGTIQPIEFFEANPQLSFHESNAIKYVYRWRVADGIADLEKAKWYIDRMIELEDKRLANMPPASAPENLPGAYETPIAPEPAG